MRQLTVYREEGRFAGWPANYGAWAFGDELVAVFALGYVRAARAGNLHARDTDRPFEPCQVRSLDGGATWQREPFNAVVPGAWSLSADEHVRPDLQAATGLAARPHRFATLDEPVDFLDPQTVVLCARTGLHAGSQSWFYVSRDRCRSWQGPYALDAFGRPGIAARTDIVARSNREALWLVTSPTADGGEGGTICLHTSDGGQSFEFRSVVAHPSDGDYAIMPSTVTLAGGRLLTIVRHRHWLEARESSDFGASWRPVCEQVAETGEFGNPASLVRLPSERVAVVYGRRAAPYAMCIKISNDGGRTWCDEIVMRHVRGNADFGYPRTVTVAPGRYLTLYYLNDEREGDRYIAATAWSAHLAGHADEPGPGRDRAAAGGF